MNVLDSKLLNGKETEGQTKSQGNKQSWLIVKIDRLWGWNCLDSGIATLFLFEEISSIFIIIFTKT